jgi:hypothetical protein
MLYQLSKLTDNEREIVMNAPVWVSVYVALADYRITKEERKKIVQTVHTKTFSEKNDLSELYKELDINIEQRLAAAISSIPVFQEDKEPFVRQKLVEFNAVLHKLPIVFARQLHKSLKDFALYTAQASGGILGVSRINETEKGLMQLDMIQEPQV